MTDLASEFLTEWTFKREHQEPISREEATRVGARWEEEAQANGISPEALEQAAQGSIADYLLRTFGEAGDEFAP